MVRRDIVNITQRQFDMSLQRESVDITDFYTNEVYKVFFRKANRSVKTNDNVIIYYPQSSQIDRGTIFTYKGNNYIVVTKDALESDVYFTSVAFRCNETWNIKGTLLPVCSEQLSNSIDKGMVSMVTGKLMVKTKDIPFLHGNFVIGDTIYAFGCCWKVIGKIFVNGVTILSFERELTITDLAPVIVYEGDTTVDVSVGSVVINPYIYVTDSNRYTIYPQNPSYILSSSDGTIASFDGNTLNLHAAGTVDVTIIVAGMYENGEAVNTYTATNTITFTITGSGTETEDPDTPTDPDTGGDTGGDSTYMTIASSTTTDIAIGGSYKLVKATIYNAANEDITATYIADKTEDDFVWTCSIIDADGTDLGDYTTNELITWNDADVNSERIKIGDSDRSLLTDTLRVKCQCDGMEATCDFVIGS